MSALLPAGSAALPRSTLRRVSAGDEGDLCVMYRSFEPKGAACGLPPREHPEQWLASLRGCPSFLLEIEGRALAHGVLCCQSRACTAELALFVHQDWRGHGFGRQLLRALVEEARQLGLRRVWGLAEPWNHSMRRLAVSAGFRPCSGGTFAMELEP